MVTYSLIQQWQEKRYWSLLRLSTVWLESDLLHLTSLMCEHFPFCFVFMALLVWYYCVSLVFVYKNSLKEEIYAGQRRIETLKTSLRQLLNNSQCCCCPKSTSLRTGSGEPERSGSLFRPDRSPLRILQFRARPLASLACERRRISLPDVFRREPVGRLENHNNGSYSREPKG